MVVIKRNVQEKCMDVWDVYRALHTLSRDPKYSDVIERLGGEGSREYVSNCNELAFYADTPDELIEVLKRTLGEKKKKKKKRK